MQLLSIMKIFERIFCIFTYLKNLKIGQLVFSITTRKLQYSTETLRSFKWLDVELNETSFDIANVS